MSSGFVIVILFAQSHTVGIMQDNATDPHVFTDSASCEEVRLVVEERLFKTSPEPFAVKCIPDGPELREFLKHD